MNIVGKSSIIIFKALSHIPTSILYRASSFFAICIYTLKFLPFQVMTRRNLQRVFPNKSRNEISVVEFNYYKCICDFAVEYISSFSPKGLDIKISYKNINLLYDIFKNHDYIICLTGHFLNYEALTKFSSFFKDINLYCIYLSSGVNDVDDFVINIREKYGAKLIESSSALRKLLKIKEDDTKPNS